MKELICPGCGGKIYLLEKTLHGAIQHHLWGGHNMEVIKSHNLAKKIVEKRLTDEEIAELRHLSLKPL